MDPLEPVGLGVSRSHGQPHRVVTCSRGYRIYHRHGHIVMEDIVLPWWGPGHKYAVFSASHLSSHSIRPPQEANRSFFTNIISFILCSNSQMWPCGPAQKTLSQSTVAMLALLLEIPVKFGPTALFQKTLSQSNVVIPALLRGIPVKFGHAAL